MLTIGKASVRGCETSRRRSVGCMPLYFTYILWGLALRILAAPFPFQVANPRSEPILVPTWRHSTDLKGMAAESNHGLRGQS